MRIDGGGGGGVVGRGGGSSLGVAATADGADGGGGGGWGDGGGEAAELEHGKAVRGLRAFVGVLKLWWVLNLFLTTHLFLSS